MAARKSGKPIVLITGAAGNIGTSLAKLLAGDYRVVGLDRPGSKADFSLIEADLADDKSVEKDVAKFEKRSARASPASSTSPLTLTSPARKTRSTNRSTSKALAGCCARCSV